MISMLCHQKQPACAARVLSGRAALAQSRCTVSVSGSRKENCYQDMMARHAQVERLTLEVEWAGHPSVAPADQKAATHAKWKPNPVAMWLPAETPATKVKLLHSMV